VAFLAFQTAVEEISDVQALAGLRFPEVVGCQKEAADHTFVVPPPGKAISSPDGPAVAGEMQVAKLAGKPRNGCAVS
jgi:hypothetical protein